MGPFSGTIQPCVPATQKASPTNSRRSKIAAQAQTRRRFNPPPPRSFPDNPCATVSVPLMVTPDGGGSAVATPFQRLPDGAETDTSRYQHRYPSMCARDAEGQPRQFQAQQDRGTGADA